MEPTQSPAPPPTSPGAAASAPGPGTNTLRAPARLWLGPSTVPAGTPLEQNAFITRGYIRLAYAMQGLLDPDLRPGGVSLRLPNWFAFAPHASQDAGTGMLGAALARRIIDTAQGEPSRTVAHALDRAGLSGPRRAGVERMAGALSRHGLPGNVAASLGALVGALNLEPLSDPRTLVASALRLAGLYLEAPGFLPLTKAEAVVRTLERLLNEGNVAIFTDIGNAGEAYLSWREGAGAVTPERVLREFTLLGARAEDARRAYGVALVESERWSAAPDFERLFPGVSAASLLVAGFALYEQARQSPGPEVAAVLTAAANLFVAWREQHDAVQPAFTPRVHRPDEVSRPALMRALTPLLSVTFGTVRWTFSEYADAQRDRDRNPLTSKPTEYNWSAFPDRWPAILTAFSKCYRQPGCLWELPGPLPRLGAG